MPLVSVIIPVKNGETTLENCLLSIRNQRVAGQVEIIILDSDSSDNSAEIASRYSARIIKINAEAFNHGLTRNIGVKAAESNFLYFTVQDAYFPENNHLEKMIAIFEDKELQGVTGIQGVPNDIDKNPAHWFKRISKPVAVYKHFPGGAFIKLSLKEQFLATQEWDNVNAMYRKKALEAVPFCDTQFAEDKLWAREALSAGMKLAFDPSLLVYHYHHRSFRYSFSVQYIVNYSFYKYFGLLPTLPALLKPLLIAGYRILKNSKLSFKQKVYWMKHNFFGLLGDFMSHAIFLIIINLFGHKVLKKSFKVFCRRVPQGTFK